MTGINTGILTNAIPLSTARIKELEREVLENGKAFVYLDENSELCFAMNSNPEAIKKLAWNNAYELFNEDGTLTKKAYKKDSLDSYYLNNIFTKQSYTDNWQSNNVDIPTEERLEGDGAEYYIPTPTALSFRSTAPLNELQEIQINGVTVDPSNYTLEEGSTIVTFPIDYLKTLNVGGYEVAVVSENKTAKGDFTVTAPQLNEYGFYYNHPYCGRVDALNSMVIVVFRENGICDVVAIETQGIDNCSYTISGNQITVTTTSMGVLHCTILSNGRELFVEELQQTFETFTEDGLEDVLVADRDYVYMVDLWLGQYTVYRYTKSKSSYAPIRTGIYGRETNSLAEKMFYEDYDIIEAPAMPNTLQYIGNSCFENCINLTSLTLPKTLYWFEIEGWAFANTALSEVYIPSPSNGDRTAIGVYAFSDCKNLCKVTFDEVVSIGEGAFRNCVNLTTIIYEGTTAQWNAISKGADWNLNVPATHVQCSDGTVAL